MSTLEGPSYNSLLYTNPRTDDELSEHKTGLLSLDQYGTTSVSDDREQLIRYIADDIACILKISSDVDDSTLNDIVEKLKSIVPDPGANRRIKVEVLDII